MERYALHLFQPAIAASPGLRVLVVRDDPDGSDENRIVHDVLPVVGFQPTLIHHYSSDEPRSVHPDPILMQQLGWHYRHPESRYAPICIMANGRLATLDPDEPRWCLLPPNTSDERITLLARKLRDEEIIRQTLEHGLEDQDQGNVESD